MAEDAAAKAGKSMDRAEWRLVMPVHLADTREEAMRDVAEGSLAFNREYFEGTLGRPADPNAPSDIESVVSRGGAIVGTPDDAIAAIESLFELSGGFGGLLLLAHEWATREKTWHSHELWARYVAPRFQGQMEAISGSQAYVAANRGTIFGPNLAAIGRRSPTPGSRCRRRNSTGCSADDVGRGQGLRTTSDSSCPRLMQVAVSTVVCSTFRYFFEPCSV